MTVNVASFFFSDSASAEEEVEADDDDDEEPKGGGGALDPGDFLGGMLGAATTIDGAIGSIQGFPLLPRVMLL